MSKFFLFLGILIHSSAATSATFKDQNEKSAEVCGAYSKSNAPTNDLNEFLCRYSNPQTVNNPKIATSSLTVYMTGSIKPGDEIQFEQRYLKRLQKGGQLHVFLTSDGGDVETSIRLGRLLRIHEAKVHTKGSCLSSCVLVLIGGVDRVIYTDADRGAGVGLHRPYFGSLSPNLSSTEIANKREFIRTEIAAHIKEMGISTRLLDLMEAVPPERMKMLSKSEVSDLGLDSVDAVWDEKRVALSAPYYAIPSAEFRKRKAMAGHKCRVEYDMNASSEESSKNIRDANDCEEAMVYGLTVTEYRSRYARYEAWLKNFQIVARRTSDGKLLPSDLALAKKCSIDVMTTNAIVCLNR